MSVSSRRVASATDEHVVTIHPGAPFWAFGCLATLPHGCVVRTIDVDKHGVCRITFTAAADL